MFQELAIAHSLVYESIGNRLYISLRHQGVIAVDWEKWELLWWMADDNLETLHPGVPNKGMNFLDIPSLQAYRVTGDGETDGPKNQHALFLHANGNLGMFDNQGDEKSNPSGSRYVEYKITGSKGNWTASKKKEYRDSSIYSRITSDVDFVGKDNENLLISYGVANTIREISFPNTVSFEMRIKQDTFFYRVDKMPLYPYQDKSKKYSLDYNAKTRDGI